MFHFLFFLRLINASGCVEEKPAIGTMNAAKMFFQNGGIEALISSRCAEESLELAKYAYFWKIPIINRNGLTFLSNNKIYPTLIQVNIILKLFKKKKKKNL